MTTTPKRRRLQFGLRGLLIGVVLLAMPLGWLANEWRFVQQRQALGRKMLAPAYVSQSTPPLPFWRRWLGESPLGTIFVDESDEAEMKRYFPEAEVRIARLARD